MLAVNLTLVLDGADDLDRADLRHALVEELEGTSLRVRHGEGHPEHDPLEAAQTRVVVDAVEFNPDGSMTFEGRP
jgi:hypothetical protein